jgi:hypothetical protein
MSKGSFLSVGEVAEEINVPPRVITNALYDRKLDVSRCPIVAGRRLIPRDYLPEIARILRGHQNDAPAAPANAAAS